MARTFLLALDHGRTVGAAWGTLDQREPHHACWTVPAVHGLTNWDAHFDRIDRILTDAADDGVTLLVLYETPLTKSPSLTAQVIRVHVGMAAITEYAATTCGARPMEQGAGTARKVVLGRGTFPKPMRAPGKLNKRGEIVGDVKAEVAAWCAEYGWDIQQGDCRDAALLWRYGQITWALKASSHNTMRERRSAGG